jgi:hypothetical protein
MLFPVLIISEDPGHRDALGSIISGCACWLRDTFRSAAPALAPTVHRDPLRSARVRKSPRGNQSSCRIPKERHRLSWSLVLTIGIPTLPP